MLYFTWIFPLLFRIEIATYVTFNTSLISENGSIQTYYYNGKDLCTHDNYFNIGQILNLSTSRLVYGLINGDFVELSFRPNQIIEPDGLSYTYKLNLQGWKDLATTQIIFKAPVYVNVFLNSRTTFNSICGMVNASDVVLYGHPDINVFDGVCLSFRHYTSSRPGQRLLYLRIVQEPDSVVSIYEVYYDFMVKRIFKDIRQITRLVFDMWNVRPSELIHVHMVNVVIKECHENQFASFLNTNHSIIRHNYRFSSRVAIYVEHVCTTVDYRGLYDLLLPENFVLRDVLLVPSYVSNLTKEITIKFHSRLTTTSVGIEKALHFFEHNLEQLSKSLNRWNDYRVSSSQHVIHLNVLADANCTLNLLGLKNESVVLKFHTYEKIRLSVNNTGTYAYVQISDFAGYKINFDDFVPEKIMCISYRKPEEIFYLPEEFELIVYKILKQCLRDV